MLWFQGIRPHLTSNCPRRKKLFKAGRFNIPRNMMRPPNVIHTVLGRAFPHEHHDTGHRHNCAKSKWNLATFRQPRSYGERSPTGGAGVRGGGRRQPRRGDARRGGPTAVEHTEGGGTTSVPRVTANVCPRASCYEM